MGETNSYLGQIFAQLSALLARFRRQELRLLGIELELLFVRLGEFQLVLETVDFALRSGKKKVLYVSIFWKERMLWDYLLYCISILGSL